MHAILIVLFCSGILAGCGKSEKGDTVDSKKSTESANTHTIQYLGVRLLDLVQSDPMVSPLPTSLTKELKECSFPKDEDSIYIESKKCDLNDIAPTYKKRPTEEVNISAVTPRCCLNEVTVGTNQLTYEKTLDLFEGIPGVKKKPATCPNIEVVVGRSEFFTIAKDGINKFVIQENTDGGSGGSQTTTTIYYGMPNIDCALIADQEERKLALIREKNIKQAKEKRQSGPGELMANSTPASKSNRNNIFVDPKTGIGINTDSKSFSEGACAGLLAVKIDKGELTIDKVTEDQANWIRTRGRKGTELMAKFTAEGGVTSVAEMLIKGRFTQEETEFFTAFLQYRRNMEKTDFGSRAFIQVKVCGDAGFSARL
jgi:hypothetical protein